MPTADAVLYPPAGWEYLRPMHKGPSFARARHSGQLCLRNFALGLAAAVAAALGAAAAGCGALADDPVPTDTTEPTDLAAPPPADDLRSARSGPCPEHMVLVAECSSAPCPAFCVDRYEAALVRRGPPETPWPFDRPPDGVEVSAIVAPGIKPQAYISQAQARKACQNAGKRLCKETEWERACRGTAATTYPYGETYQKDACNEGRAKNPVNDCFGNGPGVFSYENMNDPCCVKWPDTVALVGAFAACRTPLGVYDLHGNLHEWVDTLLQNGNGVFRGGFFVDAKLNGAGCGYRTTAHRPTYHDYSTGFRCCAEPVSPALPLDGP
jgi:hypothetical protein